MQQSTQDAMLDHVGITVSDFDAARSFYLTVLEPLGFGVEYEAGPETPAGSRFCGFGRSGRPQFWINEGAKAMSGVHIAFTAADRASVDAFHATALAAGARDNGAPGLRPHYHPHYYGAFVFDANGNNIEAVCHRPQ